MLLIDNLERPLSPCGLQGGGTWRLDDDDRLDDGDVEGEGEGEGVSR